MSGTAVAATGGNFLLGKSNAAGETTALTNRGPGATLALHAHNRSTPVLAVGNNHTRIRNLNADYLDGLTAARFQRRVAGTCTGTTAVQSVRANGTVTCTRRSMFAAVDSDGTLARGSGVTSATRLGAGTYQVTFNRNISSCGWVADIGFGTFGGSTGAAFVTVAGRAGTTDALFVATFDTTGGAADEPFLVIVVC